MYREENEVQPEKKIGGLLDKFLAKFKKVTKSQATEYGTYIQAAAKLTGMSYYVTHTRIERAFAGKDLDFIIKNLQEWVHQAEKSKGNKGALFNWLFKQYREKKHDI